MLADTFAIYSEKVRICQCCAHICLLQVAKTTVIAVSKETRICTFY